MVDGKTGEKLIWVVNTTVLTCLAYYTDGWLCQLDSDHLNN